MRGRDYRLLWRGGFEGKAPNFSWVHGHGLLVAVRRQLRNDDHRHTKDTIIVPSHSAPLNQLELYGTIDVCSFPWLSAQHVQKVSMKSPSTKMHLCRVLSHHLIDDACQTWKLIQRLETLDTAWGTNCDVVERAMRRQ